MKDRSGTSDHFLSMNTHTHTRVYTWLTLELLEHGSVDAQRWSWESNFMVLNYCRSKSQKVDSVFPYKLESLLHKVLGAFVP